MKHLNESPGKSPGSRLRSAVILIAGLSAIVLAGCTTSPKVSVRQSGDASLSCAGLADELGALDQAERRVRANKGMTGKNVIGAVLWLPGYVYSQNDAERALSLIGERRTHLRRLRQSRGC